MKEEFSLCRRELCVRDNMFFAELNLPSKMMFSIENMVSLMSGLTEPPKQKTTKFLQGNLNSRVLNQTIFLQELKFYLAFCLNRLLCQLRGLSQFYSIETKFQEARMNTLQEPKTDDIVKAVPLKALCP